MITSNNHAHRQYLQYAAFLAVAYAAVFGWLLISTDFLPYVMDNNESFSSYWHAINLAQFDFFKSFGLTDEAYGFSAAAHPYVYTHQGNFPRLFNLVIYALGARSIESQIAITTFTVGVAAIFMAYHFFSKIANPLFALMCCLLLITDYVLVAQWQVVTYRVWHMFFVFSSMLCVHWMVEGRRFWALATVVNFACLFYYEFVFVAFVSLSSAIYAAYLCRHKPKRLFGFWMAQGAGGLIGLSLLALQLYLYLGWDDFKMDAYLTFVARNEYQDSAALLQRMREFFDSRNIVFWYNFGDGTKFRNIAYFLASLFYFEFQVHTPFLSTLGLTGLLVLIAVLVFCSVSVTADPGGLEKNRGVFARSHRLIWSTPVMGALALTFLHLLHKHYRGDFGDLQRAELMAILVAIAAAVATVEFFNRYRADDSETLRKVTNLLGMTILAFNVPSIYSHVSSEPVLLDQYSAFFMGYILIFLAFFGWIVWGHLSRDRTSYRFYIDMPLTRSGRLAITLFSFVAFLGFFVVLLGKSLLFGVQDEARQWFQPASSGYFGAAFIAAACAMVMLHYFSADSANDGLTSADVARKGFTIRLKVSIVVLLAALLIAGSWKLYNPRYGPLWLEMMETTLWAPLPYLLAILVMMLASAAVIARPGTFRDLGIVSALEGCGVFLLAGFAAYVVVYMLSPGYVFSGYRFRQVPFTVFHTVILLAFPLYVLLAVGLKYLASRRTVIAEAMVGVVSLTALGIVIVYWAGVQLYYVERMPPDHYSFLNRLSKPPYAGRSFVVNTYAAPVAAKTGNWAYLNAELMSPRLVKAGDRYEIPFDTTYLWFADKRVNPDYARPAYFLCIAVQTTSTMVEELRKHKGLGSGNVGCESNHLVHLARYGQGNSVYPALEFAEADKEGPGKVGYERWAIVRLNWTH